MKKLSPLRAKLGKINVAKASDSYPKLGNDVFYPEGDLHHLSMAHEIKSNPKRYAAAKMFARNKIKNYSKI